MASTRWQSLIQEEHRMRPLQDLKANGQDHHYIQRKRSFDENEDRGTPRGFSLPGTATLGRKMSPSKQQHLPMGLQSQFTLPRRSNQSVHKGSADSDLFRASEADAKLSELSSLLSSLAATTVASDEQPAEVQPRKSSILGMDTLETLYAPMRNLNQPLLSQNSFGRREGGDDEACVEASSVIGDMPPPLAPVQSHAVLEQSLGHEIRPVSAIPKANRPLIPLSSTPRPSVIATNALPAPPAMPSGNSGAASGRQFPSLDPRTSLMSTGSSNNSSEDEVSQRRANAPRRDWTSHVRQEERRERCSASPCPSEELLSVSQQGDDLDLELAEERLASRSPGLFTTKESGHDAHYMNILYRAVQQQGGRGSVERALSPYLALAQERGRPSSRLSNGDRAEPIYVELGQQRPKEQSLADRLFSAHGSPSIEDVRGGGRSRCRSSSTSRLQEIASRMRRVSSKKSKKSSAPSSRARQVLQWKALLQEVERKRLYRVGLNLFNWQPEAGVDFLVRKGFLELSPVSVATFLKENTGLSQEKVGEYLGELQNPFNMRVLSCFMQSMEFRHLRIDKALRHLLRHFRIPGEAQKIERIMEEFGKRYNKCNPNFAAKLKASDSTVTLGFAVMLLNTDLYTPNVKSERRMTQADFVNNLRGVDAGSDFDAALLKSIYKSLKKNPFEATADHVVQTQLLQKGFVGANRPDLAVPHRRLVCVCRLYEVPRNRDSPDPQYNHPRDLFLFNDVLVVTKQSRGDASSTTFSYRNSIALAGLEVSLFSNASAPYGVLIRRKRDLDEVVRLHAGSQHDQYKFVMDLQESIFEIEWTQDEMRRSGQ